MFLSIGTTINYISTNTLETSGEDVKLHSKRVEKMLKYTRSEWRRSVDVKSAPLPAVLSFSLSVPVNTVCTFEIGMGWKLHSKRVEKM
jgi:hypothetical protein